MKVFLHKGVYFRMNSSVAAGTCLRTAEDFFSQKKLAEVKKSEFQKELELLI